MTKTKTAKAKAKAKAAAAIISKAQTSNGSSKKVPTAPNPSIVNGVPSKSTTDTVKPSKVNNRKLEPKKTKSSNVLCAKAQVFKPRVMPGVFRSVKDDLFGNALVERMLVAASNDFFKDFSGFRQRPELKTEENFDLLCEHNQWDLPQASRQLNRLLAQALAKSAPWLLNHVFADNFLTVWNNSLQKMTIAAGGVSANAIFKTSALENRWGSSSKVYKLKRKAFVNGFYRDCAVQLRDHPSGSELMKLLIAKSTINLNHSGDSPVNPPDLNRTNGGLGIVIDRDTPIHPGTPIADDKVPAMQKPDTLASQFEQLALTNKLTSGTKKYTKERSKFYRERFEDEWSEIAYTPDDSADEDDDSNLGVDISKASMLSQYQNLCHECGIDPVPSSISQCRKQLNNVYINIYDLLDARDTNNNQGDGSVTVRRFATSSALAKYSIRENKIYPKAAAKSAGALRNLLVHIFG